MKKINYSDFFIAVYIHECKQYCDIEFFEELLGSDIGNATVEIVDNSIGAAYTERIKHITKKNVHHIDVSRDAPPTQFLRNVANSVNFLRNLFLKTNCKYFVILEADVIPPKEWLHYFMEVIDKADIIGGIYYPGFHSQEMFDNPDIFQLAQHVLSGCTLYKRKVIEAIPFRWSTENINAFPDGWMSYDAVRNGNDFKLANYSKIRCKHLTKEGSDSRGLEDIN